MTGVKHVHICSTCITRDAYMYICMCIRVHRCQTSMRCLKHVWDVSNMSDMSQTSMTPPRASKRVHMSSTCMTCTHVLHMYHTRRLHVHMHVYICTYMYIHVYDSIPSSPSLLVTCDAIWHAIWHAISHAIWHATCHACASGILRVNAAFRFTLACISLVPHRIYHSSL